MREGLIRGGHTGTFSLLLVLTAVEGAISTWLAARFHKHHNQLNNGVRDRTSLIAFTSWLTFIFCIFYLAAFRFGSTDSIIVSVGSHAIVLVILWIFWLAGAASITSSLSGGINCSTVQYEVPYCNQLNAEMGFAWASWVVVTFALLGALFFGVRSSRRGEGFRGAFV